MSDVAVRIPAPLRAFTADTAEVALAAGSAATVADALAALVARHPKLRLHLFHEDGRLRPYVNLYVNEDDVRALDGVATRLAAGDALTIVPSIAGGEAAADGSEADDADPMRGLSRAEIERYARHLIMPEVGPDGQRQLRAARVLLIGAGGLGSPAGLYLAAAGVGTIGLVDDDVVDRSNLQRQVLYGESDVGRRKLDAAAARLADLNPHIAIEPHPVRLSSDNALDILDRYDVIVDGSDNFPTRYLVNDACVLLGKPDVYGSIFRFEGQVSVFDADRGPCYRCLFREPPPPGLVPSCAEGGVLGVLPGIVGSLQANEAIKLVLGAGEPLLGRLLLFDALALRFRELKLRKDPECPACGTSPSVTELIDYDRFCGLAPEPAVDDDGARITASELRRRLDRGDDLAIIDVREPREWDVASLESRGARLIPLGELAGRLDELDRNRDIILHCRGGGRSARAAVMLREAGFDRVYDLEGGLLAWIEQVDPTLPRG